MLASQAAKTSPAASFAVEASMLPNQRRKHGPTPCWLLLHHRSGQWQERGGVGSRGALESLCPGSLSHSNEAGFCRRDLATGSLFCLSSPGGSKGQPRLRTTAAICPVYMTVSIIRAHPHSLPLILTSDRGCELGQSRKCGGNT